MTLLLLQMTVIVLTALACGWVAERVGQTRVIGEIAGGILLGPSVLGRMAPGVSGHLLPQSSLASLETLSTVGLVLFLFLIGTELEYAHMRREKAAAAMGSGLSILLPFALAAAVAPALRVRFAPAGVRSLEFMLFLGISMSITAFPVLARILEERGLQFTPLGTTALLCAALDDVCAWCLLAVALTLVPSASDARSLPLRLLLLMVYVAGMIFAVRPVGAWFAERSETGVLSYSQFGVVLAGVLASAAATDAIGVHPLFGAFLAGCCFPRRRSWQTAVRTRLDTIVSVLLLPLFFALTGVRTRLDLLSGSRVWFWTVVVLAVAVVGKMGGAVLASRWTGHTWRHAAALGALLNTRGLVELVVLNIAYNAHVFSPTLFTMMVVMALITTAMTTPMLNLLGVSDMRAGSSREILDTM